MSVRPDETLLPTAVTRLFLQTMPIVAARLSVDFRRGIAILSQPNPLLRWRMVGSWLVQAPEFLHALEHLTGVAWHMTNAWPRAWCCFWQETEQEYAARMFAYLRPERLRITAVAPPNESPRKALMLLRECLRQDHLHGVGVPPPETYLYDEPLIDWIMRPLLAGAWIERLATLLTQSGALSREQP